MSRKTRGNLLLLLTAFIWGTAFVAQSVSMEHVEPFTFNAVRLTMAGFALWFAFLLQKWMQNKHGKVMKHHTSARATKLGGVLCGAALFIASSFQQFGVKFTTAGKAGFITALYIVIVPVLALFFGKRAPKILWLCVAAAVTGLYLLSINESFIIGVGDLLVTMCALFFAVHIMIIDHFSTHADVLKMACIQFFVCAALSAVAMIGFENPSISGILSAKWPILFCGLFSGGLGYTLQMFAQRDTDPAVASLVMSLESVFAVLAGWALLSERLTLREGAGCVLMFAATVFAQLPVKKKT